VVWLKRDLRLRDHQALVAAAQSQLPVLLIYVFEPCVIADAHYEARHWRFVWQSIADLNGQLAPYNTRVLVFFKEVQSVFTQLMAHFSIAAVYSHQEIGLACTYTRDKYVASLLSMSSVDWYEYLMAVLFVA
jgi:deoxyribodipyrimidine photo-lyase